MNISINNDAPSFEAIKPDINTSSTQYDIKTKDPIIVEDKKDSVEDKDLAIKSQSSQGDDLKVSKEGMQNSAAMATVKSKDEDGTVAQKDPISIEADSKAAEMIKEQIKETKENQKKAMEQLKETDEKQKENVSNLSAMTKQQVEELYKEGKISRYDYEKNMAQREEKAEQFDNSSNTNKQITEAVSTAPAKEMQDKALIDSVDSKTDDFVSAAVEFSQVMH